MTKTKEDEEAISNLEVTLERGLKELDERGLKELKKSVPKELEERGLKELKERGLKELEERGLPWHTLYCFKYQKLSLKQQHKELWKYISHFINKSFVFFCEEVGSKLNNF